MARVQLALNVEDVDAAVDFYSRLFDTKPHKQRPGYANFEIADPPLKLVLIEGIDHPGSLNHLGVEVATPTEVVAIDIRLNDEGLETVRQEAANCCHAVQDKSWVTDPSGRSWEIYTILDDNPDTAEASALSTAPEPVRISSGSNRAPCC